MSMSLASLKPAPWLLERLPVWSLRHGPQGVAVWQWIALVLLAFVCLAIGSLLAMGVLRLLVPIARRTMTPWDDALLARARGPLSLFAAVGLAKWLLPIVALDDAASTTVGEVLTAALLFGVFWSLWRIVDVVARGLADSPRVQANPGARWLLGLSAKSGKIILFVIAVIAALQHLGFQVASLIAGLGIGGLAIALAAQKTLENLFGSVTLGVDRPLAIGDFVKIEDMMGTVEQIGLRSTRIRTLDRTLITVPNGRLADMKIENYAPRDRIRLAMTIGLEYGTPSATVRRVLEDVRAYLRGHEKVATDTVSVSFVALADSWLSIEILAMFDSPSFDDFKVFREEALLELMRIVEARGASFAFPTRTVHHAGGVVAQPGASPRASI
jgi:MscS family membrane protein